MAPALQALGSDVFVLDLLNDLRHGATHRADAGAGRSHRHSSRTPLQNFVTMPMTFLSGVFYSVKSPLGVWYTVSYLDPFFYMIDGFRRGFFGHSDVSPWLSLGIVGSAFVAVALLTLELLRRGYKLRA